MKSGNHNFLEPSGPLRGPGRWVGIATDYGLDSPGSNPGGEEIFRPAHPASCKTGTGSFPGLKSGRGVLLTTHSLLCRGHGRVELYLYPPSGPHRACNGITLPFYPYIRINYSFPYRNAHYFAWRMCENLLACYWTLFFFLLLLQRDTEKGVDFPNII